MITQYRSLRNSCSQECFIHAWHRHRMTDQILARTVPVVCLVHSFLEGLLRTATTAGLRMDNLVLSSCYKCLPMSIPLPRATSQQHPVALLLLYGLNVLWKLCLEAWDNQVAPKYWPWAMKFAYTLTRKMKNICNINASKLYNEFSSTSESAWIYPPAPTSFHKIKQARGKKIMYHNPFSFSLNFVSGKY